MYIYDYYTNIHKIFNCNKLYHHKIKCFSKNYKISFLIKISCLIYTFRTDF